MKNVEKATDTSAFTYHRILRDLFGRTHTLYRLIKRLFLQDINSQFERIGVHQTLENLKVEGQCFSMRGRTCSRSDPASPTATSAPKFHTD